MIKGLHVLLIGLLGLILLAGTRAPSINSSLDEIAHRYIDHARIELVEIDSLAIARCYRNTGEMLYFIQSKDIVRFRGYQGYTNLGIMLDSNAIIQEIWIISSDDTRQFVKRIIHSGFLNQFHLYHMNKSIKNVTGASITSQAIKRTVEYCIPAIQPKLMQISTHE
jgi:hypothetical protein